MAIKKTVLTASGLTVDAAYCRTALPTLTSKESMRFDLACFNVSPEANPTPAVVFSFECSYEMDSNKNIFEQAYLHIKSLPEWADAVDC